MSIIADMDGGQMPADSKGKGGPVTMTNANDNYPIESKHVATAGGVYYPEMGERHDGNALFVRQVGYKGYIVAWLPERHAEALAVFKALRIRPAGMECARTVSGYMRWSACVTSTAGRKLGAYSATEALL